MPTTLCPEERNLHLAVAELAYALVLADHQAQPEEEEAFIQAVRESLGEGEWLAIRHYQKVQNQIHPNLEASYKHALHLFKENKRGLTKLLIRKFLYVLECVAEVMKISSGERELIERFEKDLYLIFNTKDNALPRLQMNAERRNLYSTLGQMAYVIVVADHTLLEEEKKVFRQVIQEQLGEFGTLAESRFQVLCQMPPPDLEGMYEHGLYLMEQNRKALDEPIIQSFIEVLARVAEVAGISPEERGYLNRFQSDIYQSMTKESHEILD
ncbi:MAG: hypothetical protein HC913_05555 [Microscillaceae bacterium]|nr:hypothetical protein [Microscillaceae bacterium]